MTRWSYLRWRLAILGAALLALWLGLNPLARWSLVSLGQRITGAKVEIGELSASLARTELALQDLQVADPGSPMENLFEARELTVSLEGDSLLRRKLIVREGRIGGLRFNTPRTTSGALKKRPHRAPHENQGPSLLEKKLVEFGELWMERLAALLQQEVREEVEQLQSVELARELLRRWPAEYEQMEARVDALRSRVEDLRRLAKGGVKDLVRDIEAVRTAAADAEELQRHIGEFHGQLDRLRRQAQSDKEAIAAARRKDLQTLQERFRMEELNGENLSEYLLGPEWGQRLRTLVSWIDWGRKHLPKKGQSLRPARSRGVDVLFAGTRPRPDFLIRRLLLEGEGQSSGRSFQFTGSAEGLTSQPAVCGQPAVLKLEVRGAAEMTVAATLDHTQETPHERLVIECPNLRQPQRVLGRPDRLALSVSPGSIRLGMDLELKGDDLSGKVHWQQGPVELAPALAPRYGGPRLAAELADGLRRIRSIDVTVDLNGTLHKPECKLRSNLGPQLTEAVNWAVQRELQFRRDQLAELVEKRVDAELARFEQVLLAKERAVLAKLEESGPDVNQLRQLVAQRVRLPENLRDKLPDDILERRLPADLGKKLKDKLPLRF